MLYRWHEIICKYFFFLIQIFLFIVSCFHRRHNQQLGLSPFSNVHLKWSFRQLIASSTKASILQGQSEIHHWIFSVYSSSFFRFSGATLDQVLPFLENYIERQQQSPSNQTSHNHVLILIIIILIIL